MPGGIHTRYRNGAWVNEIESGVIFSRHPTRELAIAAGRALALGQRIGHVVHDADGGVTEKYPFESGLVPDAPAA